MAIVSLIVPFFNKWDLTHQRLGEFYRFLPLNEIEVVLINDASTENDCEGGIHWWQKELNAFPIKYYKNPENVGFGKSMNNGAKIATGDVLVFYSNDVQLSGNFIPELLNLLTKNSNILIGNEVIYWDGGWNSFDTPKGKVIVPYANGWFVACTREVWSNLKGFDYKTFGKFDYEDVDLSMRALNLGYNIVALNSSNIAHRHQGSTVSSLNVDRLANTQQNRIKFIAKWGHRLAELHGKLENRNVSRNSE